MPTAKQPPRPSYSKLFCTLTAPLFNKGYFNRQFSFAPVFQVSVTTGRLLVVALLKTYNVFPASLVLAGALGIPSGRPRQPTVQFGTVLGLGSGLR